MQTKLLFTNLIMFMIVGLFLTGCSSPGEIQEQQQFEQEEEPIDSFASTDTEGGNFDGSRQDFIPPENGQFGQRRFTPGQRGGRMVRGIRVDAGVPDWAIGASVTTELTDEQGNLWQVHDLSRPAPPVVEVSAEDVEKTFVSPPSDAIVLFDGSDLSQWKAERGGGEAGWTLNDGVVESTSDSGGIVTRQAFGSCQLHIEFATPSTVIGSGQSRGNSGVFLMSRYEIQVLDSYNNHTYPDGQCAALYGRHLPLVNVSHPPGQWQSYDITFHRPIFEGDEVVRKARFTVYHNGELVHNDVELEGGTQWINPTSVVNYVSHDDTMPLMLQDHNNPVKFRNIWIIPLED